LNQEDKPKHFKGDIFNGWEEDGEPGQQLPVATHFSSRYFDKRRPK
jgi:hypothetical protein